ncbi:sigma-54-dependent Fis family transcriptional regulator [Pseudomonas sp. XS1P51]
MDTLQFDLQTARALFSEGAPLPAGLLPDSIARSWTRSRDAGLLPHTPGLWGADLDFAALTDHDHRLAEYARPEMERLWQLIGDTHWMLFCVNPQNRIVHTRQPQGSQGPLLLLQPGRRVAESDVGTTAPACTLAEGIPTAVVGNQHYLQEFERFFCVSVPVHGLSGEVLGALDLTGIGSRNAGTMLERLNHAAMAAENHMFDGLVGCRVIALQHDPRLLGTPLQALLAIREDGSIEAANRAAQRLLGIEHYRPHALTLHDLFEPASQRQIDQDIQLLTLTAGVRVYGKIQTPAAIKSRLARPSRSPLGGDPRVNEQFDAAGKAFLADLPVLILGATGTGKEVFARALHQRYTPNAPFIAVNCAAIPDSLIEAELFGYSEGSFTGARKGGSTGLLEAANGGTLLLDEIGDMPLTLQTRLLRVLQDRRITRLGSSEARPFSVRIVAATHCALSEQVARGLFREDLYYRLDGFRVELPPLSQRVDIVQLIDSAIARHGTLQPDDAARALLCDYAWPGNLRQLDNVIRRAVALSTGELLIRTHHLPPELHCSGQPNAAMQRLADTTRQAIERALLANAGNVSAAATQLGISRTTLYKRLGR